MLTEAAARTEIKAAQDLGLIATFVEKEVERQVMLIEAAAELQRRAGASVSEEIRDVTSHVATSESKVVRAALTKGGKVVAWALPGFAGLLKGKLGPELAARARIAGVGGVFPSDPLPAGGRGAGGGAAPRGSPRLPTEDAFVLVAGGEGRARAAIEEMRPRAEAAIR